MAQLALSEPQVSLLLELLEGEQKELLVEIRHTDTKTFRAGLKERLAEVELLIGEVQATVAGSPAARV
jgi:hypothetical protein